MYILYIHFSLFLTSCSHLLYSLCLIFTNTFFPLIYIWLFCLFLRLKNWATSTHIHNFVNDTLKVFHRHTHETRASIHIRIHVLVHTMVCIRTMKKKEEEEWKHTKNNGMNFLWYSSFLSLLLLQCDENLIFLSI